ncbi:HAD domain-containing protein [Paraburkholderia sp. JHI2823]|uniref:HAD domain-containing protein n=1 Tax=Paraburkholderia sp. JHI2823 TaxID=3112960 RepID=UPI003177CA9F
MNIYLNFDGVLHPDEVHFSEGRMPTLATRGHKPFEHANVLSDLLTPYPKATIVLNTWWTFFLGVDDCLAMLPWALAHRVIGTTLKRASAYTRMPTRMSEAERHVAQRHEPFPLILDHNKSRYSRELTPNIVLLRAEEGLSSSLAQQYIVRRLAAIQSL